jgi:filamentous hemagglutinin
VATNAEIKASQMAQSSYKDFATGGLQVTDEVMATPQAQALVREIQASNPTMPLDDAVRYAEGYIASGTELPIAATALPGSQLIKVVPNSILPSGAGTGSEISPTSGYWMTLDQAKALQSMSPEQMGQVLGLPAGQAARMANDGFEFYMITPKPGQLPSVFVSDVAPTSQGTATMPGGAQQVIVPNRSQWTNPVQVDPTKL